MLIEAIVIKKIATREHDQLVTLYSRQLGKTLAIAKSIFKSSSVQALQLDEGNLIQCELVSAASAPIITGAQALRCYSSAKSSPLSWSAAQFFLQVIDVMVFDHQADEALWDCIGDTLAAFDSIGAPETMSLFRQRQAELLRVMGYGNVPTSVLDETYEQIAQRRFMTLELFYGMVGHHASRL